VSDDLSWGIFLLMLRVERLNIDVERGYTTQTGHITVVPTTRIPKRLVLTANCYQYGVNSSKYTFIIDVLLVPRSFDTKTCFGLYLDPFVPDSEPWYMGTRSPRDDITLLRRIGVHGEYVACAAEQFDIPDDIRYGKPNHRLVVACPVYHYAPGTDKRGVLVQLDMEF